MQVAIINNKEFKPITLEIVIESQGELNVLKAISHVPLGRLHGELNTTTSKCVAEDHVFIIICALADALDDLGK